MRKSFEPRPHYDRTRDDWRNIVDDVRIYLVPRYKTSGLSGDEWRVSACLELRRKGSLMVQEYFGTVDDAIAKLPWIMRTWCETAGDEWTQRIRADESTCHQAGCAEPAAVVVRKKQDYCDDGQPHEIRWGEKRRAFCTKHSTRGDCGLDDADRNYEPVSGTRMSPPASAESPSVFGGVIRLGEDEP